jgi:hypothetical protein
MTITLTPQTEAKLREKADSEGQDMNLLADELLAFALEWDTQDYVESVQGIKRGLEAFAQGRSRSFHEFAQEQRAKHNLPSAS